MPQHRTDFKTRLFNGITGCPLQPEGFKGNMSPTTREASGQVAGPFLGTGYVCGLA